MPKYKLFVVMALICLCGCRPIPEDKPNDQAAEHAKQMDVIRKHLDNGDIQRAQDALQAALASGYEHPMAHFLQGRIYCAAGTREGYAQSIPYFEKAIAASPAWIEPRLLLAQSCIRDGRHVRARQLFEEINRLQPHSATGPYGLGLIAALDGKNEEAITQLDESLSRNPDFGPALLKRASLSRDTQQQRHYYERYIAVDPMHAGAHAEIGGIYQKLGRSSDAWRAFERSYELAPNPETARRLAELAANKGDLELRNRWQKKAGMGTSEHDGNTAK